ncbi:LuxR C-terminal-related transcriptional regulator [Alkalihalophilus sp. As8PL]|uniref:LuxR C-terminal-related transcriptional regulator n=1 Tax=Alkalihalophilus sp. As8PL TaxID=3237103 RepID=A0AB39BQM0_9BACI
MSASTTKESITFITTDTSLPPKIKEDVEEPNQSELSFYVIDQVEGVNDVFKRLKQDSKKDSSQCRKYIWVISKQNQRLAKEILNVEQASIIAIENEQFKQSIHSALKHYPYLDLPFQKEILQTVAKHTKPPKSTDLTVCLEGYTQFNQTEKDIICHLLRGKTAEQIAELTYNSIHTINNNIVKIKRKLNVTSKVEIITYFVKKNRGM